jgi:hypothetical protein
MNQPLCKHSRRPTDDYDLSGPAIYPCPVCGGRLRGLQKTCSSRCRAIRWALHQADVRILLEAALRRLREPC